MGFDRAAHRAQAARIVEHTAGGEVLLRFLGKGDPLPAAIVADRPPGTRAKPDVGAQRLEVVTIARDVFAAAFAGEPEPREGQHFTAADGRLFRIQANRSASFAAVLVFACTVTVPVAAPASA